MCKLHPRATIVVTFFLLCLLLTISTEAQTSCESNSALLDVLISKAKPGDQIVAIARLGKLESDENLNQRRLHNLNVYVSRYRAQTIFSKHPGTVILLSGRKTEGLGTVEIYFQGTFFTEFRIRTGEDLYVGECAVDLELYRDVCEMKEQQIFYPCIDRDMK